MYPELDQENSDDTEYVGVMWTNYYLCVCGEEWQDTHSCCCNDHCPVCNKEIEPYISDDGSLTTRKIDKAYQIASGSNSSANT